MLGNGALWLVLAVGLIAGCGPKTSDEDTDPPADDAPTDTDLSADTDATEDTDVADTDVLDTDVADTDTPDPSFIDSDGDGFTPAEGDCDDGDTGINPGEVEVYYDDVDANCDSASDYDADGDGHDSDAWGGTDCNDADADINPDVPEVYYDGVDADCSGGSDYDADGDGYEVDLVGGTDCDDESDTSYPGAFDEFYDGVDANCDGADDFDADADGQDADEWGGDDCDDADPDVYLGADDVFYDGADSDCMGNSDYDADSDGYDSDVTGGTDCDDTQEMVNPGVAEVCNGVDDDCDGTRDEADALDALTFYLDDDQDGFGAGAAFQACDGQVGWSDNGDDCDDTHGTVYPSAPTVACDGLDNDCDANTEELGGGAFMRGTQYDALADALANAAPGELVEVCEGRHFVQGYEPPGALTLQAKFPSTDLLTLLDAEYADSVLEVHTTAPIVLRGLRFVHGKGTLTSGERRGGAIWAGDGTLLILEDCAVTNSRAGVGAGIWIGDDAELDLVRTYLVGNEGDSTGAVVPHGGNLAVGARSAVTMTDSLISGGTAGSCGGVDLGVDARLTGDGVANILNNSATLKGGGVCAASGAILYGLTIDGNTAPTGAGINATDVLVSNSRVRNNVASLLGGGLALSGACSIEGGEITNNRANVGVGGIDLAFPTSTLKISGTLLTGNVSAFFAANAGGVEIHGGTLTSMGADWGGPLDNSPADISLSVDGRTYNYAGAQSFTCDDGAGTGCL